MPIVIVRPSFSMSAMYLADGGKAAAVVVPEGVADGDVVSVEDPPAQADTVPTAKTALRPSSRMRGYLLM
jgi:hypothetical protein